MISALLLPLLLTGAPAQPAVASLDDPPIRLWINNDRRFYPGDRAKVEVRTTYDGYLIVLHVDPEGHVRVLFPLDPDNDSFVRGGKKYEIRGRGGREAFEVDRASGQGAVYAAVSRDPFRFDGFVLDDHWDYRALAPSRLASDPEPELNELVHRLAQGSYDYDLLTYEVFDHATYASDYSPRYYGSGYGDPWCSFSCGFGYSPFNLSIGVAFGRPFRHHYYDPFFPAYDPFYSPFFYDPYYYAPVFYPRFVSPRRFYGFYNDQFNYGPYRGQFGPSTPYRFRGADGFTAGYRIRGQDLRRSINTVYTPPLSRVREPATVTPGRRLVGGSESGLSEAVTPRRSVGHEERMDAKPIEARRAREHEAARPARGSEAPGRAEPADDQGRSAGPSEARPARREAEAPRNREAPEPRAERPREESRQVERAPAPAPEARSPRREVERSSAPPSQDRGGRQVQGGSWGGGGSRSEGGSRPSDGGGRRR